MAKGWHSPTGSRTKQVRSLLGVLIRGHGQPGFTAYYTAPLGAMVTTPSTVYMWIPVTPPQPRPVRTMLAIWTRIQSLIHHHNLGSLVRQVPCSQVQRVRLGGNLLHRELLSFPLRTTSLSHKY